MRRLILISVLTVFGLTGVCAALTNGQVMPVFTVQSATDEIRTQNDLKGAMALVFYESKDTVETTRQFKNALGRFYEGLQPSDKKKIIRLVVIDCRTAAWPFTGIWKDKLKVNSVKEGLPLYGDWTGKMAADFGLKENQSHTLLFDERGVLLLQKYGPAGEAEAIPFLKLIQADLSRESNR